MNTQNFDFGNERAALAALRSEVVQNIDVRSGGPAVLISMWAAVDHLQRFIGCRASLVDSPMAEFLPELDANYAEVKQLIESIDIARIGSDKSYASLQEPQAESASKNSGKLCHVADLMKLFSLPNNQS